MKPARAIPLETVERQRAASDPALSAWVSANAGSGKTTVLTRRVIRLLLTGVAPQAILCLTFTKAAAANMQNRIFATLGGWTALSDTDLAQAVRGITGTAPDAAGLVRARRLFAAAIETPGGLKILTIHAFCERVLHLFPFEANVPAQFAVLDERAGAELLQVARARVLFEASAQPASEVGQAMARILAEIGEDAFDTLLDEITRGREKLRLALGQAGHPALARRLRQALDLADEETVAAIEARLEREGLPASEWPSIAAALRQGGEAKMASLAARFEAAAAAGERRGEAYRQIFLTAEGEPRAAGAFLTKAVRSAFPALAARLEAELARIAGLMERRAVAACAERTAALLVIAQALLQHYAAGKRGRGVLDFDDLIIRTSALLERAGAEWVLYKLDRGIDHILVDEAQDTSPAQWRIVERLAQEFTAGEGARDGLERTLFAVGDEKQSIFSFQGAAPAEFDRMKHVFAGNFLGAGLAFQEIPLTLSFRSTEDILQAVDQVFEAPENFRGLSADEAGPFHQTIRAGDPGHVEIWPVERPEPVPEILAWDAPFDEAQPLSPANRLARKIAAEVRRLVDEGDGATGARFSPGDVMILVRSRNAVFEAIIRALKQEGVPVAGADRLVLQIGRAHV